MRSNIPWPIAALLLLVCGSESTLAFAATIRIQVVRTADDDTQNSAASVTAAQVAQDLAIVNTIYASTGLQFVFDPAADFEPFVRNDTGLNRDFYIAPGANLSDASMRPATVGAEDINRNRIFIARQYPGKLVVFYSFGSSLVFNKNPAIMKWESVARGGGAANFIDPYVLLTYGAGDATLMAHELGHFFHQAHTHGVIPTTLEQARKFVKDYVASTKIDVAHGLQVFDADRFYVSDTNPDPANVIYDALGYGACGATNNISLAVNFSTSAPYTYTLSPDRGNVMSYFKHCTNFNQHFSPQQAARVKRSVLFGNRNYLIAANPNEPWSGPSPSLISWGNGRLDIFSVGVDQLVRHKALVDTTWYPTNNVPWEFLGGLAFGSPTAVSFASNRLDVFVQGQDNGVWHRAWNGSGWIPGNEGWENLGGAVLDAPAAVSWGPNRIDLFARGNDKAIWHKAWSNQGWSPSQTSWEPLFGAFASAPQAVSWAAGRIDVFAVGTDGRLYHKAWAGELGWIPKAAQWEDLGGSILGVPAVTTWGNNRIDIVVRGTDNQIWHKAWTSNGWAPSQVGWTAIGGATLHSPAMVSWGPNRLDIVVVGTDKAMYHKAWSQNAWFPSSQGWNSLGGRFTSDPRIATWGVGRLDIVGRDDDGEHWHKSWDNSQGWSAQGKWTSLYRYIE